jgi:MYXO-CTERM domain-containing protein
MRRALVGLALLVAATAQADWRTASVPGTPREVDVWAPGTFSVATSSHAVLFVDGGIAWQHVGSSVGTALTNGDCFVSVLGTGSRVSARVTDGGTPGPCVLTGPIFQEPGNTFATVHRMKQLPEGPGMAIAYSPFEPSSVNVLYSPRGVAGPSDGGTWSMLVGQGLVVAAPTDAFGVARVDGSDHGLFATQGQPVKLVWFPPGDWGRELETPSDAVVRAVALSSLGGGLPPYAVFGSASGIFQGLLQGTSNDFTAARLPEGSFNVSGLDMNLDLASGVHGGFGMAVARLPDGGHAVLSALPNAPRRQESGSEWRLNPTLPSAFAAATLEEVACSSASYCVITVKQEGGNNLLIYSNAHRPVLSADTSVVVDEGQSRELVAFATDDDGDAVRVTSSPLEHQSPTWTLGPEPAREGEALRLRITGGAVCTDTVVSSASDGGLVLEASDGRAAHQVRLPVEIMVRHSQKPAAPRVSPATPSIGAGEAGLVLTASGVPTGAGCLPTGFRWEARSVNAPVLGGGNSVFFEPPRHVCAAAGVDFDYQLVAYDSAGDSPPTPFTVHVAPWGPPERAFAADAGVRVQAGVPLFFAPEALHICQAAEGFPGVETTWSLAPGMTTPEGLEFLDADGEVVRLPMQGTVLGVRSPQCMDARFRLGVRNHLRETGVSGPDSEVEVTVAPRLTPLASGEFTLRVEQLAVGELEVAMGTNLECPASRGLSAELRVERVVGGVEPVTRTLPLPGSVRLTLPPGCERERFRVTGVMREEGGTDFVEKSWEVEADSSGLFAGLEPLPPEAKLVARCGEGARGTLTQTFPVESCSNPRVTWSQVEGPALALGSLSGDRVSLSTSDTGLDELVGQSVVLRVEASGGPGNVATREHRVPITTDPFVQVRRRAELPAADDTSLVGVSVELSNTTACGVRDVRFMERLEGMVYVPGSARFAGVPVEAEWKEGVLTVEGLPLEGRSTGTLTYVARPLLLGERRMAGEALLRGIPISLEAGPKAPSSGCSCSGTGGASPALLVLGALAAALRRRRR